MICYQLVEIVSFFSLFMISGISINNVSICKKTRYMRLRFYRPMKIPTNCFRGLRESQLMKRTITAFWKWSWSLCDIYVGRATTWEWYFVMCVSSANRGEMQEETNLLRGRCNLLLGFQSYADTPRRLLHILAIELSGGEKTRRRCVCNYEEGRSTPVSHAHEGSLSSHVPALPLPLTRLLITTTAHYKLNTAGPDTHSRTTTLNSTRLIRQKEKQKIALVICNTAIRHRRRLVSSGTTKRLTPKLILLSWSLHVITDYA